MWIKKFFKFDTHIHALLILIVSAAAVVLVHLWLIEPTDKLPRALADFHAEKCWHFWSAVEAGVHNAVYQVADRTRLVAVLTGRKGALRPA